MTSSLQPTPCGPRPVEEVQSFKTDIPCAECVELRSQGPAGKAQYDYHFQKVHREYLEDVKAPGLDSDGQTHVKRGEDKSFACPTGCGYKHAHGTTLKRHAAKCGHLLAIRTDTDPKMINADGSLSFAYLRAVIATIEAGKVEPFEPATMRSRTHWNRTNQFMDTLAGEELLDYVQSRQIENAVGKMADIAVIAADAWDAGHQAIITASRTRRQLMSVLDTVKASMARPMGVDDGSISSYRAVGVSAALIVCHAWYKRDGANSTAMKVAVEAIKANAAISTTLDELCANPTVDLMHRLWFGMLASDQDKGPRHSVLCVVLAALAVDDHAAGSFKTATRFTPTMSRLLYALRCGFYPVALQMCEQRVHNGPPGIVELGTEFLKLHKMLLSDNSNPTNGAKYLVALRAYGRSCAKVEAEAPQFLWNRDGMELAFRGIHIPLDTLRLVKFDAIRDLKDKAQTLFAPALRLGWKPSCDFSKLTDDPANATPGFSFMDMKANQDIIGDNNAFGQVMLRTLRASGPVSESTPPQIPWDEDKLRDLVKARADFLKALAVVLHLTNRPLRGTEGLQSSFRNPAGGRHRTFFIGFDGELIQDVTHNKSDYMSNKAQHNIRIVHPYAAEPMLNFLIYAQPLFDFLDFMHHGQKSCYLWFDFATGRPSSSKHLSRALENRYVQSGVGLGAGLRAHRQIDAAVDHKHERERSARPVYLEHHDDDEEDDDDDDDSDESALNGMRANREHDLLSLQTGRSLMTTMSHYGLDAHWRLNVDPDMINLAREGSENYARLWGLDSTETTPGYKTSLSPLKRRLHDLLPSTRSKKKVRSDVSSPIGSFSETGSCSVNPATSDTTSATSFQQSVLGSGQSRPSMDGDSAPSAKETVTSKARHPLPDVVFKTMLQLYGDKPNFKGFKSPIIADALQMCVHTVSHFLLVANTAAGKSATWQIMAKLENGLSVIAAPYTALTHDIAHNCAELGLSHIIWTGSGSISPAASMPKVVIVSYNHLIQPDFLQWATLQAQAGRLRRIFIDEAHVIVDETYRWVIRKLSPLSQLRGVQLVLMSATIPKEAEEVLERRLCTRLHVLREPTQRLNIKLSVTHVRNKKFLTHAVKEVVDYALADHPAAQVLVVCRFLEDARELARQWNVGFYHSTGPRKTPESEAKDRSLGSDEPWTQHHWNAEEQATMQQHLQAYVRGEARVLVGTSAVGVGVHCPSIRHVIFFGAPWTMSSFAQNAGRAGRNGEVAQASIFTFGSNVAMHFPQEDDMDAGTEALRNLLLANRCLRIPMSHYLDGKPVQCLDLGAERCSVCEKKYGALDENESVTSMETAAVAAVREETYKKQDLNADTCRNAKRDASPKLSDARSREPDDDTGTTIVAAAGKETSRNADVLPDGSRSRMAADKTHRASGKSRALPRTETTGNNGRDVFGMRSFLPGMTVDSLGNGREFVDSLSNRDVEFGTQSSYSAPISPPHHGASPVSDAGRYRLPPSSGTSTVVGSMDSPLRHHSTGSHQPLISTREGSGYRMVETRVQHSASTAQFQASDLEGLPRRGTGAISRQEVRTQKDTMRQAAAVGTNATTIPPATFYSLDTAMTTSQGSTSSRTSSSQRPASQSASQRRTPHASQLAVMAEFEERLHAGLLALDNICPVCAVTGRKDAHRHTIQNCPQPGFGIPNIITFRKNGKNNFPPRAACWKCALPQDLCKRANQDATCRYARHADAIRAILMLLCRYHQVRQAAAHSSQQFGPLLLGLDPEPRSDDQVGTDWLQVAPWKTISVYKAFPLVAAIILRLTHVEE
ncbi:hypothetical protein CF319_g7490 [Tilletia indica]|nr:hypothetical protein CF319_g7490 [Tilletia indica]